MKYALLVLFLGGLVSGCASNDNARQEVESTQPESIVSCCSGYSDFYWTQLSKSEAIEFQIDAFSPVWRFPEGKSFFNAFEFAEQSKKVEITLRSYMLNGTVFAPKVVMLDSQFQVIDEFELSTFRILYSDALQPNRYEATLTLDASISPYFIIYASSEEIGKNIVIPHPAKVRAINSGDPLPIVTDLNYENAYVGKFELNVKTISLRSGSKRQEKAKPVVVKKAQTDTVTYYKSSIQKAVQNNDIPKALALLEEAKALNIEGAQDVFVEAVNSK